MASRPSECDRNRLQDLLHDELSDDQQAELADHLEGCPQCRKRLEQMAAASNYWSDAVLVRGEQAAGILQSAGVVSEGTRDLYRDDDDGDIDTVWLEFLDPPDPAHPDTIGRLGSYEILELLGRGGMGVVLKARDPALERTVAIKVLTPSLSRGASSRRRFAREARAVAAVGHENIVAIHAIDEFRGLPYLVMQYVPGRSLQERLDASGPLEVREILRIGIQSARALAAAHAQGVVHRDIKPANILLENCVERVKLTDFGLARAIDDASLTQSGTIAGTPQYMAPEQARGESVNARADLFALGASLYAMASGRSPFRANSAMAVLKRVCEAQHQPIRELNPDVPGWLEATIDRLLAKEPADRFQTAGEVADLLEKGLAHLQQPTILAPPRVPGDYDVRPRDLDLGLDLDVHATKSLPRARRRLPLAAALVLLSVAGLGVTEAAGLTQVSNFVATILRIKTADGTLVIKVDDPQVEVRIDGDTVVIGGAGRRKSAFAPAAIVFKQSRKARRYATSWSRLPGVAKRSSTSTSRLPVRAPPPRSLKILCLDWNLGPRAVNRWSGHTISRLGWSESARDTPLGRAPWSGLSRLPPTGADWPSASKASTGPIRSCESGIWPTAVTGSGSSKPRVFEASPSRRTADPWFRAALMGL